MAGDIKSIMKLGADYVKKAGKKKLITFSVLALLVILAGIIGAVMLNHTNYTVLYSELSSEEAGTIFDMLKEEGVDVKVDGTDTILVPEDQADEIRVDLATQGYPSTGLNYGIFSDSSSIGSTDLEQQTYKQYQLQENMRTTVSKFDKIKDCIVIVNLATSSSYVVSNNTTEASVAIWLEVEDGESLSNSEARTIAEFALTCVPNLKLENISIVDNNMDYYDVASDADSETSSEYTETQMQLTEEAKDILSEQAMTVLEPAVGDSNLAISVNLSLNFDSETVTSVEFSPPVDGETEGLVISSEEIYEALTGDDTASGEAGTDSNGVSDSEYVSGDVNAENTASGNYDNTYNYELNQIQSEIEKAQGSIEDLSVSVLVNSNVEGISDYLDTIKSLVANAIGVNEDYITVGLMPFVESSEEMNFGDYLDQSQELAKQYTRSSLIKTGIIAGSVLLMLIVVMLFLRNMKYNRQVNTDGGGGNILDVKMNKPVIEEQPVKEDARLLEELTIKKSDDIERVEGLVDKYPETVAQILRSWLED